ncbi:MAG: O-antigen ligase family protein [Bacteroidales bacterium]
MKKNKETAKKTVFSFSMFIFIVLIVMIPNLYYKLAMDQQLEIRMLALSVFLGLLFIPLMFIKKSGMLKQSRLNILKNPVVILYAGLIFMIGISVFWATNQSEAIYELLKRLCFFILFLYLLLFVLPEEGSRLSVIKAFVVLSLIITATGIFQVLKVFSETKYGIDAIYLITGNFAQKNIFSEVLFITFAFCLYGILALEKLWKRLAIAGSLLSFLFIVFLMTRAIWASLLIALAFSLVLFFVYTNKDDSIKKIKTGLRFVVIIFCVIMIGLVIFSLTDKNKTIQHQISNAFDFKQGNTFHRLNLWEKSISLAKKHPLEGVGAGNWRIEILQYDLQVNSDKGRIMPDRAHNDYLQLLVENGLIGISFFLLRFAFLMYFCVRIFKKTDVFLDRFFILTLFFALLGYMVDSSFAFPRERIGLQIFLNIIFAFIVFEYQKKFKIESENKSQTSVRPYAIILFSVLIICSFAAYKRLQAEVGISKIYTYIKQNNHEQIIKITDEIYSPFSTISPFSDPIMQIKAMSMYQANKDLKLTLETYDKSIKDSPYHLETLNELAIIHKNEKNYTKAIEFNERALKYAPSDVRAKIIKSEIMLSMNKIDDAYKVLCAIDTNNTNSNYRNAIRHILLLKIGEMMSQSKNDYLAMPMSKLVEQSDFLFMVFKKSLRENEVFEKTLLDQVLMVCDKEKIKNDPFIQQLKNKYKVK